MSKNINESKETEMIQSGSRSQFITTAKVGDLVKLAKPSWVFAHLPEGIEGTIVKMPNGHNYVSVLFEGLGGAVKVHQRELQLVEGAA